METFERYVWLHGKSLFVGLKQFGPEPLRNTLDASPSLLAVMASKFNNDPAEPVSTYEGAIEKITEAFREHEPAKQARDALEQWGVKQLIAGKLLVYAYAGERRHGDQPVRVESDVLHGVIRWCSDTLFRGDFRYSEARLIHAAWMPILRSRYEENAGLPSRQQKKGRPSKAQLVHEAYRSLLDRGSIDPSSLRANYPRIRQFLQTHHKDHGFDGDNPSDETIRTAIGSDFQTLRRRASA